MSKATVAAAILLLCVSATADATMLSGRVGLSTYLWQRDEVDSSETRHWQNTGTLSLRLDRIRGQDLAVETSLRGRSDSRNAGGNVDDYRLYNLRARWRDVNRRVDLSGGRHRVNWPSGSASIDGGSAVVRPWRGLELSGFYGLLAPEDGRFKMTEYDDGHAIGAQVGYRTALVGNIAAFFVQRNQSRTYWDVPVDNLASRLLGLDWRRPVTGFGSVYGHLTWNLPTERIQRVHLSARWQAKPALTVNGQFRYRRPDIPYNSIFWVFGPSRYYEGRLRVDWQVSQIWSVNVGCAEVDLSEGNITRFDLGLGHRYFSVGLNGQTGDVGGRFGVSGDALYPVNDRWSIRGGARHDSFELMDDQEESSSASSVWAGVRWTPIPQSSIDLEGQYLSQNLKTRTDVTADQSDFRILARVSWSFARRLGE